MSQDIATKPEWVRIEKAVELFGIGRTTLYRLIGENKIRSTCIKERGKLKGIRLISFDSLAAFIEKSAAK